MSPWEEKEKGCRERWPTGGQPAGGWFPELGFQEHNPTGWFWELGTFFGLFTSTEGLE